MSQTLGSAVADEDGLHLACGCGTRASFSGGPGPADKQAVLAGWGMLRTRNGERYLCPSCCDRWMRRKDRERAKRRAA